VEYSLKNAFNAATLLKRPDPWWWRQYVPLKRRSTIILHGSTSQKTILKRLHFWRATASCPYHGDNSPWPQLYAIYTASRNLWLVSFRSAVTRQNHTGEPMVTQPSECLCYLGRYRNSTWVYVTCGPGFGPWLAYKANEKSPLNIHFWVPHRDTSWKLRRNRGTAPER